MLSTPPNQPKHHQQQQQSTLSTSPQQPRDQQQRPRFAQPASNQLHQHQHRTMTIILFLVDTSASMCQRAHINGVQKSYLDIAKGAVETFLKYRQRSADCMGDRYMLLTFEDPPANVKAGWKENHGTFMNELKNLQSAGLTSMGEALRNAFDLLNLNRMMSGIDTYGQGRCPFYLEPSVIIVLTDGGKYTFKTGVQQEIVLPLNTHTTGAKLTKEPFRWDQRLYSLVLRMGGARSAEHHLDGKVPHDDSPIEKMCEVTGGRSYKVRSQNVLNQCIESLVQKVQSGVVVHFDAPVMPLPPAGGPPAPEVQPDLQYGATKKMLYVQKHPTQKTFPLGFWPIPEPYWPDQKVSSLPSRDAHPRFRVCMPAVDEPPLIRNFPVDKYEIEACTLTYQILCKRDTTKCWPVFVSNGIHGLELPFGYLKAGPQLLNVHLVILPYNYMTLLPLLNELLHKYGMNPPSEWVFKFNQYIRSIPQYYGPFLRRALAAANVPFQLLQYILPDNLDSYLNPAMAAFLKTMKTNAKQEQENVCLRVFKQLKLPRPAFHQVEMAKLVGTSAVAVGAGSSGGAKEGQGDKVVAVARRELISHPQLRDCFEKQHGEITALFDGYVITVPQGKLQPAARNYRNPFDVPRRDLIEDVVKMRENFARQTTSSIAIYTKDAGHSLPIADMGNYQEYLKSRQQPLRELEPTNVRQHMFGNPYKKDKHMVMVDEADVGEVGGSGSGGSGSGGGSSSPQPSTSGAPPQRAGTPQHHQHLLQMQREQQQQLQQQKKEQVRPKKRKAGPIHKDYVFKRRPSEYGSDRSSNCSSSPCSPASGFGDGDDYATDCSESAAAATGSSSFAEELAKITGSIGGDSSDEEGGSCGDALVIDEEEQQQVVVRPKPKETAITENGHHPVVVARGFQNGGAASLASDAVKLEPVEPAGPPPPLPAGFQQPMQGYGATLAIFGGASPTIPAIPSAGAQPAAAAAAGSLPANGHGGPMAAVAAASQLPLLQAQQLQQQQQLLHHHPQQTGPPPNDFQAQEISKILQQCTSNGLDTTSSSVASAAAPPSTSSNSGSSSSNVSHLPASQQLRHQQLQRQKSADDSQSDASSSGTAASASVATAKNRGQKRARLPKQQQKAADSESDDGRRSPSGERPRKTATASAASCNGASSDPDTAHPLNERAANGRSRSSASATAKNHANLAENRRRSNRTTTAASTAASASASAAQRAASAANSRCTDSNSSSSSSSPEEEEAEESTASRRGKGQRQRQRSGSAELPAPKSSRRRSPASRNHGGQTMAAAANCGNPANSAASDDGGEDGDEDIRLSNVDARRLIFRDIRRPGRDYSQLLEHMHLVRGAEKVRETFVQMCVEEALRFRRRPMAETIEEWWAEQLEQQRRRQERRKRRSGAAEKELKREAVKQEAGGRR